MDRPVFSKSCSDKTIQREGSPRSPHRFSPCGDTTSQSAIPQKPLEQERGLLVGEPAVQGAQESIEKNILKTSLSSFSAGDVESSGLEAPKSKQEYRQWLESDQVQQSLQACARELEKYLMTSTSLHHDSSQASHVEVLKKEANFVFEKCKDYVNSNGINASKIMKKCIEYYDQYKRYLHTHLEYVNKTELPSKKVFIYFVKYQWAVLDFATLALNKASQNSQQSDAVLNLYVERMKDAAIVDAEQKQQLLRTYRGTLESYEGTLEHCQREYQEHWQRADADSLPLAKKVDEHKKHLDYLGERIRRDYLPSDALADFDVFESIKGHYQDYREALGGYEKIKHVAQALELDRYDRTEMAFQKLGSMIEATEKIREDYVQLVESALEDRKGKKSAKASSIGKDREVDLIEQENLQEYRQDPTSEGAISHREKSKLVMQRELEAYLSDPTDISNQRVQEIARNLVEQVKRIYDSSEEYLDAAGIIDDRSHVASSVERCEAVYKKYSDFGGQKQIYNDAEALEVLSAIDKHQKAILQGVKSAREEIEYKDKDLENFIQQLERNYEADIAEKQARELGDALFEEKGLRAWIHTTIGVAYMRRPGTQESMQVVSINEGSLSQAPWVQEKVGRKVVLANDEENSGTKKHAEEVLVEYAKKSGLIIEGLGVSRDYCVTIHDDRPSCSEFLPTEVDHLALGQIPGERSTTGRSDSKTEQAPLPEIREAKGALHDNSSSMEGIEYPTKSYSNYEGEDYDVKDMEIESMGVEYNIDMNTSIKDEIVDIGKEYSEKDMQTTISGDTLQRGDQIIIENIEHLSQPEQCMLQNATFDGVRSWLAAEYRDSGIEGNFNYLWVFKHEDGQTYGTNSMNEIVRYSPEDNIDTAGLHLVWQGKHNQHKGWTRFIPEDNQNVEKWLFSPIYALQKDKKGPISVTDSLPKFGEKHGLSQKQLRNLKSGDRVDGWEIIQYKDRIESKIRVEIRELANQNQQEYKQMRESRVPGVYYQYENGHRAYLPASGKGKYTSFFYAVEEFAKINYKGTAKDTESITKNWRRGYAIDGWKQDEIIPIRLILTDPDGKPRDYIGTQGAIQEAHSTYIQYTDNGEPREKKHVMDKSTFTNLINGKIKAEQVKGWVVSNPHRGVDHIIIWKAPSQDQSAPSSQFSFGRDTIPGGKDVEMEVDKW